MATAGPRFFGFVIGGTLPAALAANWLATAWDQNACLAEVTPGVAQVEAVALRWLVEVLGLPLQTEGAFVTGATMANFTALAAARQVVLARAGWNVEADGLFDAPPITVVVGEEAHPTLLKSLGLLGLGRNRVVRVPTDRRGRMRADRLPPMAGPTIVCVQAGNINTGEFDPFGEIGEGTCWCGGTVWQGRTVMRISVCSWATTDEDVDLSVAAMLQAAARIWRRCFAVRGVSGCPPWKSRNL